MQRGTRFVASRFLIKGKIIMRTDTIFVRSAKPTQADGGGEIVLTERDERHPEGEIFIADADRWTEVYPTPAVRLAISEGRMKERETEDEEADAPWTPPSGVEVFVTPSQEANAADAEAFSKGDTASQNVFSIDDGETVDSLSKRLNKGELTMMADYYGAEYTADNNKAEIAEAILVAASTK